MKLYFLLLSNQDLHLPSNGRLPEIADYMPVCGRVRKKINLESVSVKLKDV